MTYSSCHFYCFTLLFVVVVVRRRQSPMLSPCHALAAEVACVASLVAHGGQLPGRAALAARLCVLILVPTSGAPFAARVRAMLVCVLARRTCGAVARAVVLAARAEVAGVAAQAGAALAIISRVPILVLACGAAFARGLVGMILVLAGRTMMAAPMVVIVLAHVLPGRTMGAMAVPDRAAIAAVAIVTRITSTTAVAVTLMIVGVVLPSGT